MSANLRVSLCLLFASCSSPDNGLGVAPDAGENGDAALVDDDTGTSIIDAQSIDAEPSDDAATEADASVPDARPPLGELCFSEIYDPTAPSPDYDQFSPNYGSHCFGTNHQDITGVERVVFLGDSVTVGTPPTPHEEYYRARLADRLVEHFGLEPPSEDWKRSSILSGMSQEQSSGDFASCADWGARTHDFMDEGTQLADCFPEEERNKRTLVIMTMGGNDIAAITKAGAPSGGQTYAEVEQMTIDFVAKMESAIAWLKDPTRFPAGVFVVYGNMFEFTDATGDASSCPAAGIAGFDEPWTNPDDLKHLVIWANEEYVRIAVESGTDVIFLLEHFCGHGYHNEDPMSRCYRGPGTERWFDLSCIHPNPTGHQVVTDMFMSIVLE